MLLLLMLLGCPDEGPGETGSPFISPSPGVVIEVTPDGYWEDGIKTEGNCSMYVEEGVRDWNECCPAGWTALAMKDNNLLCWME